MLKDFTVKHSFKKHEDMIKIRNYCVFLSAEMLPVCTPPAGYSALKNLSVFSFSHRIHKHSIGFANSRTEEVLG